MRDFVFENKTLVSMIKTLRQWRVRPVVLKASSTASPT